MAAQLGQPISSSYQGGIMNQQQPGIGNAFVVVDQQPRRRETFPYSLHTSGILAVSIAKCFIGSLLVGMEIVNVLKVDYNKKIAFGIWCGLAILANGIIGCILKCRQTRCMIGAFFALSITSLIFDIAMLSFYSIVLEYFVLLMRHVCFYRSGYGYQCYSNGTDNVRELGIGLTSFLISLVVFELACSVGSIVLSTKAYSKFCNTCDTNDCCLCTGCCECDTTPLSMQQARQFDAAPPYYIGQNIEMSSAQQHPFQCNPNHSQLNANFQHQSACNHHSTRTNPCSSLVNFVVNIPEYVSGGTNGTQPSSINITDERGPLNQRNRNIVQVQEANDHCTRCAQEIRTPSK